MATKGDENLIRELIKKYKLHPSDAYIHKQKKYKVINRRGCKKIQTIEKIHIKLVLEYTDGLRNCVVRAIGNKHAAQAFQQHETYGECNINNSSFPYPHAVAQSRAEGRMILELAGLYEQGFLTEDEIDEKFKTDTVVQERAKTAEDSVAATLKKMGLPTDDQKK